MGRSGATDLVDARAFLVAILAASVPIYIATGSVVLTVVPLLIFAVIGYVFNEFYERYVL